MKDKITQKVNIRILISSTRILTLAPSHTLANRLPGHQDAQKCCLGSRLNGFGASLTQTLFKMDQVTSPMARARGFKRLVKPAQRFVHECTFLTSVPLAIGCHVNPTFHIFAYFISERVISSKLM